LRGGHFLGDNELVGGQELQDPDQGLLIQIIENAGSLEKINSSIFKAINFYTINAKIKKML
jgi:hypothetical protein